MARIVATEKTVQRDELVEFVRPRNQWVMATTRTDGRPQISPVTGGVNGDGRMVVATYPSRDKVHNIRRNPQVTVCVLSDHFGGAWVQVDGNATIVDLPEAMDGLVDYFRSVSGEHPNWDEYRAAMERQGKCLIVIDPERWGPIATGGFPAPVVRLLDELDDQSAQQAPEQESASTPDVQTVVAEAEEERPPRGSDIAGFSD
jgi:PPOX class probable F420-dependent enzyme